MIASFVAMREDSWEEPLPVVAGLDELSGNLISRYVRFEQVQFAEEELGLTWSADDADTDRHVVDRSGNRIIVRTGRHSEFATRLLPQRSGSIQGVLGYFNGKYQLVMVTPHHAVMEQERF